MPSLSAPPRGSSTDASSPITTPKANPSDTSCSTNLHHTKSPLPTSSAATSARTGGSASPSLRPDSRFSEWRIRRGTRGVVTTLDDSTGSVGDSSAPSRNASVHERSVNAAAATATMAAVIGIASTSLRSGRCHSVRSISASTSSPSRNRITTSATTASVATNPPVASNCSTSKPPSPRTTPTSTNRAVSDSMLRRAMPETSAPPTSSAPNTVSAVSVEVIGVQSQTFPPEEERTAVADHRPGQVAVLAGRRRSVQRLPRRGGRRDPGPRLRQRRLLQAAPLPRLHRGRRGRHLAPARRPLPRPRPVRVRAHLRAAPAAGPRRPLARDGQSGAAAALRPGRRARHLPPGRRGLGQRGPDREGVRPRRVRARRRARHRHAAGPLPRGAALHPHVRGRHLLHERRRAPPLRRRQRAERRARALRHGADLLIIEATLPRPEREGPRGHLTPSEAGEHGSRAKVARLVLTHISDELDELWARTEAEEAFGGPVMVAHEGAVYTV